jgi:BirA family biotin operon repressor/biotin-[acetyl-CoA-carboxylase] ligase
MKRAGALDANELIRALQPTSLGRPLFVLDSTGSTMDEARRLWQAGAPWGTAVLAATQSAGRGRRGRAFVSPLGGMYLTVLTAPCGPPAIAWRSGFAAALAAREAIIDCHGPPLAFEWPNDLVFGHSKVGGVLAEWLSAGPAGPAAVAVGVGLNLGPDPREIDADSAGPAGPIALPASATSREEVAASFLGRLSQHIRCIGTEPGWHDALQSIRAILLHSADQTVVLRLIDGTRVEGNPLDLKPDGTLVLRRTNGETIEVRHAERWID